MPKHILDYDAILTNSVNRQTYKLSEVKHRLEKVAFDIVRFKDSDVDELWQVQSADDGDYIVAKYQDAPEDQTKTASAKTWDVVIADSAINIFYKGHPVMKIAASSDADQLATIKRFLPNKLATDKTFVSALLNSISTTAKASLLRQYPELA